MKNNILKRPLKFYIIYILVTLCFSFWGPAIYKDYDRLSVSIFMLFFLFCVFIGYSIGLRRNDKLNNTARIPNIIYFVKLSIFISFLLIFIEFFQILITNPSRFSLTNIGGNYMLAKDELEISGSYSMLQLLRFLTGFPRSITLILGFYFFSRLPRSYKILFFFFLLFNILVYAVAYGTQKIFGDILIYFFIVASLKLIYVGKKKRRRIIIGIAIIAFLFVSYFIINQIQRYSAIDIDVTNIAKRSNGNLVFDTDHIVFKIFGEKIGFGISVLITSYLSAGYYGLSLCFELPFVWTHGFGNSYPLSIFVHQFLDFPNYYLDTYLNRMDIVYGRSGLRAWNTIFPWLASDLTFVGSLLIFIPISAIYAISWKETVKYNNPVSLVMFATLTMGFIFVPNNNQLLNGIDGFIGTICVFIFWLRYHNKFNIIER